MLLDCIPPVRRAVLDYMAGARQDNCSILESTGLPKQTGRSALEELQCHGIVKRPEAGWEIAPEWREHMRVAYANPVLRPATFTGRVGMIADD